MVLPSPNELAANRAAALALIPVSRETLGRLDSMVALLLQWQQHTNLVAASTLPQLWTRHVADSLQLMRLAPEAVRWADLGSGGGFPGLVVACALADNPDATVHLVESTRKKCAFLAEAVRLIEIPAIVHCRRIEDFAAASPPQLQVVTARAVAPLPALLALAAPLLKTGVIGLFPKGQDVAAELTEASKYWRIKASVEPSVTSPASGIVVVRSLEPRSGRAAPRPQQASGTRSS
jgi:16S rRNA (guanine527-N7)-methyltransferase